MRAQNHDTESLPLLPAWKSLIRSVTENSRKKLFLVIKVFQILEKNYHLTMLKVNKASNVPPC